MTSNKKVNVIGAGIVGYALGQTLRRAGFSVTFVDIDPARVHQVQNEGFNATLKLEDALAKTDISFICVPTPSRQKDASFNGNNVADVAKRTFRFLGSLPTEEREKRFHTIVIKSTVLPDFAEAMLDLTNLQLGKDFGFALNPEFLRQETAEEDVLYEQVVIGTKDEKSASILERIYSTVERKLGVTFRYIHTDFATASLIKYKHNLWLATTMGFLMEFAKLCDAYGVNAYEVIRSTANPDPVMWVRSDFLQEGFLDECLPKDSAAMTKAARELGASLGVLESAIRVNQEVIGQNGHLPYDPIRLKLIERILNLKAVS